MSIEDDLRDKHDDTDTCLHHIAGLAEALDDVLDGVPGEMTSNSPAAAMVRSVLASIRRETKATQDSHDAEWEVLKRERLVYLL